MLSSHPFLDIPNSLVLSGFLIIIIIIIITGTIVPVIIGATGIVTRSLKKNLETVPGKH